LGVNISERLGVNISERFSGIRFDEGLLVCSAMNSLSTASEMSASAAWMRLRTRAGVVIAILEDTRCGRLRWVPSYSSERIFGLHTPASLLLLQTFFYVGDGYEPESEGAV
jgi:hypothetical protein